jgi:hypothetical protein
MRWGGAPAFRGIYTAALALIALTIALAVWALVRRWATVASAHIGALVAWGLLTLLISLRLPGVSFMFAWPLIAGVLAARRVRPALDAPANAGQPASNSGDDVLLWIATAVAAAFIVPSCTRSPPCCLALSGQGR